jgi:hypothetical protein
VASTEQDVAQALGSAGIGLTFGTSVRTGPVRKTAETSSLSGAVPDQCVFVIGTGGVSMEAWADGGVRTGLRQPSVQIWVRSSRKDYDGGKTLADNVFNAIHLKPPTGYVEAKALASEAQYVTKDETDHHQWSINVLLQKQV